MYFKYTTLTAFAIRGLGCNEVQGYLIGHPVGADVLTRFLVCDAGTELLSGIGKALGIQA